MLANWVKETTATTGTGTISLGGAVSGHVAFSAVFPSGAVVLYAIDDGDNREVGYGTLTSGSPWTLTRAPQETLVSGMLTDVGAVPITLSGGATVSIAGSIQAGAILDSPLQESAYVYPPLGHSISTSTLVAGADKAYCTAFLLRQATRATHVRLNVSVGSAGATTAKAAIYDALVVGGPMKPWNRLAEASFVATASGYPVGTLSASPLLRPGWYWFVVATSGTPTFNRTFSRTYTGAAPYSPASPTAPEQIYMRSTPLSGGWSGLPADLSGYTLSDEASAPAVQILVTR